MHHRRPLIILFAKAPIAGARKNSPLSADSAPDAASLHAAFVSDMLETLQSHNELADLELHTDVPTEAWVRYGVSQKLQAAGDLGVKLLFALTAALAEGRPQVMILGSDAPTLPSSFVRELFLCRSDVALGPTTDGGYYAIACRKIEAAMFRNVGWSGPTALEETRRAIRSCGMTVEIGSPWFDVDTPHDLDLIIDGQRLATAHGKLVQILAQRRRRQ